MFKKHSFYAAGLVLLLCAAVFPFKSHAFDTLAKHAILIEDRTGVVLYAKDADAAVPPSSMSKLMTAYVVFQRLKEGSLKLTDTFTVSEKAWRMGGSKMFVGVGDQVAVEDLLRGIIIQSGNDACIVIAEGIAGTEESFAEYMNKAAKEIGLQNSHFVNATGWPDENHHMTARDLATLAQALIHNFSDYYHYYSEKEYVYNGIKQHNRNLLLWKNIGVDGLKTGHTEAIGYGLTASAVQGGRRIIGVLNGIEKEKDRPLEMEKMLSYGFREFTNKALFAKGQTVGEADIWFGTQAKVSLVIDQDVLATVPARNSEAVKTAIRYTGPIPAPIQQGDHIADLVLNIPGMETRTLPLYAGATVDKLRGTSKALAAIEYYLFAR